MWFPKSSLPNRLTFKVNSFSLLVTGVGKKKSTQFFYVDTYSNNCWLMFINGKKDSLPRKRKTTILSEILYGGSQRLTVQGYRFLTRFYRLSLMKSNCFFLCLLVDWLNSFFTINVLTSNIKRQSCLGKEVRLTPKISCFFVAKS